MSPGGAAFPSLPDRYRPVRLLGAGGSAEVILVDDRLEPARPKAMKILFPAVPPMVVEGFRGEFRLLASLEHPGLARVYEFGFLPRGRGHPRRAYYTSEYVTGRQLGAAFRERQAPVRDVFRAMAAVCRTLAYLHARGYVHNDVKPSNILCGEPGAEPGFPAARLLDFGLAGLDRARSRTVAGTPGYIAPERLAGGEWDGRADLYAVGASLYRVLGGRRVVQIEAPDRALDALRAGWPRLGKLRPDVPAAVALLCDRLLSLDPAARPRHAAAVVALLGESIGEAFPLETPGTARCYSMSSVFVGREQERAAIHAALGRIAGGRGPRVLAVGGGPGIGKSRLWRELAVDAETAGWRLASATCVDRDSPGGPLARLGAQIGASIDPGGGPGDEAGAALSAAAQGRTLFVVDDAHRGSDAVWHAAFGLGRRAAKAGAPVGVLLAFDPAQLPVAARQWLAAGTAAAEVVRVDLGPLPAAALTRMLSRLFGEGVISPAVADEMAQRAGGAPLLLEEMVRELVETGGVRSTVAGWTEGEAARRPASGSDRLDSFLRRRLADAPPHALDALGALAALGGRADMTALRAVVGGGGDVDLGAALLVDRNLCLRRGQDLVPVHETLTGLALDSLTPDRRRALHRAAVAWLAPRGADPAELARACREAGDLAAAHGHARAAGERARAAAEWRLCVRWLEEARELAAATEVGGSSLVELLSTLGEAYEAVGRFPDALAAIGRAFGLRSREPGDEVGRRERVRLATLAARLAGLSGDGPTAERWLGEAASAAAPGDVLDAVRIDGADGAIAYYQQRIRTARERLRAALAGLDRIPDAPEAPVLQASVLLVLVAAEGRFDLEAAHGYARAAVEAAERGHPLLLARAINNLGDVEFERGDPAAAAATFRRAIAEAERTGAIAQLPIMLANLAQAEHLQAGWGRARILFERVAAAAELPLLTLTRALEMVCAWREDDRETAAREAERLADQEAVWQDSPLVLAVVAAMAAETGEAREAGAAAARAEAMARGADAPLDQAQALLARAYAVAAEDPARGAELLGKAALALAAVGHRAELATIRRDAARWLARAGTSTSTSTSTSWRERLPPILRSAGRAAGRARLVAAVDGTPREVAAVSLVVGERSAELGAADLRDLCAAALAPRPPAAGTGRGLAPEAGTSLLTLPDAPRALAGDGDSRLLELTLGAIELRHAFPGVVGRSAEMLRALSVLDRLADADVPLLLMGETGTGKEIFARALHGASRRAAGPFVALSCVELPPSLFDAELRGYRRGAFTGAVQDHAGLLEQADGGFLFLDEVSELPPALQPKLLRVLQERRVRPLGARKDRPVDFRLVAATSRDLASDVAAGRFRPDLYYRLNAVELRLPPLRDRLEDIPDLCRHFLAQQGSPERVVSPGALRRLLDHHWPGNLRELDNELRRACVLAGSGPIRPAHLSARLTRAVTRSVPVAGHGSLSERVAGFEREVILTTLRQADWNRRRAARALDLSREGLRLLMNRLGIQAPRRGARGPRPAPR